MLPQIVSHYKILDKLGEGGMGVIYKAEDLKLKRTVALKVLSESFTQDGPLKERFRNEAQSASQLQHNNICTIHDIDETSDGELFIVMDYYQGETLKSKIKREHQLGLEEVINITEQISEGLEKAHESGLIHRDIKPANIFITKEGTVKILDFGLAKRKDQTLGTRMGARFGTIDYMSPEQIKGEKLDLRTDIWSLGVVVYEMLTGGVPFKADYEQAVIYLILNQDPEDVRKYRDDIPDRLISILEKCISKEKEDRYEDLSCIIENLKNVTKQEEKEIFQLPAPRPSQSIAVMPFVNVSGDQDQEYFCDGLTEELINSLSRISDLKVVARTSAFSFKGSNYDVRKIGRKLDVRTILEGSVRKEGSKLRITAQLINVFDGYHLWSERYDRDMKELFKIQDEITFSIVDVLKVKLLGDEKEKIQKRYTDNIEAYNLCQKGFYGFNQIDLKLHEKGYELFHEALKLDPNYALAYYGMGYVLFGKAFFGLKPTSEIIEEVRKCIQRILEIDENLSEGYDLLGLLKAALEWKKNEAQRAWQHSLELNPSNANALINYSLLMTQTAQFDLAKKYAGRVQAISPHSDYTEIATFFPDFYSAQYEKAYIRLSKYLESRTDFLWGLSYLWRILSFLNKKEEAVEAFKKLFIISGKNDILPAIDQAGAENAFKATADILAGIYKQHYVSPYLIALIYSHAGIQEHALLWIERALEKTDPQMIFFYVEPEWLNLHKEPRFMEYLERAGFGKEAIRKLTRFA